MPDQHFGAFVADCALPQPGQTFPSKKNYQYDRPQHITVHQDKLSPINLEQKTLIQSNRELSVNYTKELAIDNRKGSVISKGQLASNHEHNATNSSMVSIPYASNDKINNPIGLGLNTRTGASLNKDCEPVMNSDHYKMRPGIHKKSVVQQPSNYTLPMARKFLLSPSQSKKTETLSPGNTSSRALA